MIPKRIITIWLSEYEAPELVQRCIRSQDIPGYEHLVITLENVYRGSDYVNRCIAEQKWVRAVDYLRLHYLNELGGIYLDADCEVYAGASFDKLLDDRMFVFREASGYLNNGYIGAERGHPFLKYVLRTMENNFRLDHNLFHSGMQFFCDAYFISDRIGLGMEIYPDKELAGILTHHAMKSWLNVKES